jgi:hypothetical protein
MTLAPQPGRREQLAAHSGARAAFSQWSYRRRGFVRRLMQRQMDCGSFLPAASISKCLEGYPGRGLTRSVPPRRAESNSRYAASHSRYTGTMSDSPGLIALRKSLGDSSPELPAETPKQMAHDAIRQILDAIESGVCPLGDWERRCLGAAITSLRGGHTHEARSRARQALWPEENRRNAAIAKLPLRPGMASVAELKREFEAARAMPGRARRRGAETV